MIVIIVTAIAIAHIFTYGERMSEGFEEKEEEEEKEGLEGDSEDVIEDDTEKKKPEKKIEVPSADAIQGAVEGLASELKKNGVEGLSKETFDLIEAQKTLLDNLGKMSDFVKVDGAPSVGGASKKEGYCSLADAYK